MLLSFRAFSSNWYSTAIYKSKFLDAMGILEDLRTFGQIKRNRRLRFSLMTKWDIITKAKIRKPVSHFTREKTSPTKNDINYLFLLAYEIFNPKIKDGIRLHVSFLLHYFIVSDLSFWRFKLLSKYAFLK